MIILISCQNKHTFLSMDVPLPSTKAKKNQKIWFIKKEKTANLRSTWPHLPHSYFEVHSSHCCYRLTAIPQKKLINKAFEHFWSSKLMQKLRKFEKKARELSRNIYLNFKGVRIFVWNSIIPFSPLLPYFVPNFSRH